MTRGIATTAEQKIYVVLLYIYRGAVQHWIADIVGISLSSVEHLCAEIRRGGTEYLQAVGFIDDQGRPSKLARERTEIMDARGAVEKARLAAVEARYQAGRQLDRQEAGADKASVTEQKAAVPERVVVTSADAERTTEEKAKKPVMVKVYGGEKVDIESVPDMSAV